MNVYDLPNLSSNSALEVKFDVLQKKSGIPASVKDKSVYKKWVGAPDTNYHFYSPVEGENPNARISSSNPAFKMHGIVLDFDASVSLQDFEQGFKKNGNKAFPPSYYGHSFSGGIHAVWEFEEPINVVNEAYADAVQKHLIAKFRAKKICPGLDILPVGQYYTLCNSYIATGAKVDKSSVETILCDIMTGEKKAFSKGLAELPFDLIEKEVTAKFPGRWTGNFQDGARGPRFWDASSTHQNAAIMTPTGMKYFTDGGGFLPWGSPLLLGQAVVEKYRDQRLGGAISEIFHDGDKYYRRFNERWMTTTKSDVIIHLKVNGLSPKPCDGSASEIDIALEYIHTKNHIDAAMPFIYIKDPIIEREGRKYVNTNTCYALKMSDTPYDEKNIKFPFIYAWLHNMFPNNKHLEIIMSWLAWTYQNAADGTPKKGQILYLAGAVNVGKTLFNKHLVGPLLGGSYDASTILTGKDGFNENLFNVGLGTIDDEQAITDRKSHLAYSSMAKKFAANHTFSMRKMRTAAMDIDWVGRIICTMNKDAESMSLIPDLSISIKDKLMVIPTGDAPIDKVLSRPEFLGCDPAEMVRKELPHFARFLYEFKIPNHLKGHNRYCLKSYIESSLAEEVEYNSYEQRLVELISNWVDDYFTGKEGVDEWFGSASDLFRQLVEYYDDSKKMLEGVNLHSFTRTMKHISSLELPWIKYAVRKKRGYVVNPRATEE